MSKKLVKIVLVTEVLAGTLQDAFPPQLVSLDTTYNLIPQRIILLMLGKDIFYHILH